MKIVEVKEIKPADEFIVEAMMHDGKFKVIGVVLTENNLLNDDDLDVIWNLANYGTNGLEQCEISNGVHRGQKALMKGKITYVIASSDVDVVNDNIMVRKHCEANQGYYMKSSRLHKGLKKDIWCLGKDETIINEYKSNRFICAL